MITSEEIATVVCDNINIKTLQRVAKNEGVSLDAACKLIQDRVLDAVKRRTACDDDWLLFAAVDFEKYADCVDVITDKAAEGYGTGYAHGFEDAIRCLVTG